MGARAAFAAAPMLLLLLAGCSGDAVGRDATLTPDLPEPPPALAVPAWSVGDWWRYRLTAGPEAGTPTTYVVTEDRGADWWMETDSPERAFQDARDDISRLGAQRKSDLAGSQGAERVQFFQWPLRDGATWSTTWDGQRLDVTAQVKDAGVAHLRASNATGVVYEYTYDAASGWFGSLTRFGADGRPAVAFELDAAGHDFKGTVVRWTLATIASGRGSGGASQAAPFEVPVGATDLWADYHFTCTNGGFAVLLEPANPGLAAQQRMQDNGPCSQVDWTGPAVIAPHAGTWAYALSVGGQTADFAFELLVRTRTDVPVA